MSESYAEFAEADGSVRMAGELLYPTATVGDVLTVQSDGSIAAAAGGGSIPSGDGSPVGVVTPSGPGALYVDDTNGALYIAQGTDPAADWLCLGGISTALRNGDVQGVGTVGNRTYVSGETTVIIQDEAAGADSGNGLYWDGSGGDGAQVLKAFTGVESANTTILADPSGTLTAGPGGIIFPTSDPHIDGAWWDNAGTLTRSSG